MRVGRGWLVIAAMLLGAPGGERARADEPPAPDQARAMLQRAVQLDLQVMTLMMKGKHAEALSPARESLALRERVLGRDHRTTTMSLTQLGSVLQKLGQLAEARELYERVVAVHDADGPSTNPLSGPALSNLGQILADMGEYERALPYLERSLAIIERVAGPRAVPTATARESLAQVLLDMGHLDRAEAHLTAALEVFEQVAGPEHPKTIHGLTALGSLRRDQGDLTEAGRLWERALAASEKVLGPDHLETATVLNNQAMLLAELGELEVARAKLERSLAILGAALGHDHPTSVAAKGNLAHLLSRLGRAEQARALLEQVLADEERLHGPRSQATARALSNLAEALRQQGEHSTAEALLRRALAIFEELLPPGDMTTAGAANNLANALAAQERRAEAIALFERALATARAAPPPEREEVVRYANNLATVHLDARDSPRARALLEEAWARASKMPELDPNLRLTVLFNLGAATMDTGDHAAARRLLAEALDLAEEHARRLLGAASPSARVEAIATLRGGVDNFLLDARALGLTGYEQVLRFKGLVMRLESAERAAARRGDAAVRAQSDELAALRRRLAEASVAAPRGGDVQARRAWLERYAELAGREEQAARAWTATLARLAGGVTTRGATLAEVQAALPSDGALVDVLRTRDRYLAWVVRREGPVRHVTLGDASVVEPACREFVEALRSKDPDGAERASAAGRALAAIVVAPLLPHLAGVRDLWFSPDAALAAVPLAALPGSSPGSWLLDERLLRHAGAAHQLLADPSRPPPGRGALVVGGVDFSEAATAGADASAPSAPPAAPSGERAGLRFRPLPHSTTEGRAVKALWGEGTRLLEGSGATESALRREAPGRRCLHLATHGFVRQDLLGTLARKAQGSALDLGAEAQSRLAASDPRLLSGLALAGANRRADDGEEDGILTALEAAAFDLSACDVVVLSACETALGTATSGEGVLGLVQGFQLAGARSVVASLWPVDDRATALLMERFYAALLRPERPASPAEALREAALALRAHVVQVRDEAASQRAGREVLVPTTPFAAPRHWAAFVAYESR